MTDLAMTKEATLVERLRAAVDLGTSTGARGRHASNIYNLADEAATALEAKDELLTAAVEDYNRVLGERDEAHATLKYCEGCWSEERGTMIDKLQAERHLREATERDRDDARVQRIAHEGRADDLRAALNEILAAFDNQEISHQSFRVGVARIAREALRNTSQSPVNAVV